MGKLTGKVAIVTGASRGIGQQIAELFASEGAKVVCGARTLNEGEHRMLEGSLSRTVELIRGNGGEAIAVTADVSSEAECIALVQSARKAYGPIDILVNNAALNYYQPTATYPTNRWVRCFAINVHAPFILAKAVLTDMIPRRSGAIVNVGSIAGEVAIMGIYSASKFGLRGLSDSVRREVRSFNISVSLIEPGLVRSSMNPAHGDNLPPPDIVADAIVSAIAHPRRARIVPWTNQIGAFLVNVFPWLSDLVFGHPRVQERMNRDSRATSSK